MLEVQAHFGGILRKRICGSEREFDRVSDWRGFQDIASPTEVGGCGDLRPAGFVLRGGMSKSKACPARTLSLGYGRPGTTPEASHSMKVEKARLVVAASRECLELLALAGSAGGNQKGAPRARTGL